MKTTMRGATRALAGRRTFVFTTLALFLAATMAGALAEQGLSDGPGPGFGPLQLRLTYNPGVSFGFGSALPAWLVTTITGVITVGVAVYAWRAAPNVPALSRVGLAAILGGALANLLDRAMDGVVTDYLHTGWFPTFNLPDVFITCGAVLLVAGALWRPAGGASHPKRAVADDPCPDRRRP